ncbi:MAG: hypothetical protein RR323_04750 [Raoultibacter sp.]
MTGSQKALNVLSIIILVLGILAALLGIFFIAGATMLQGSKIEGVDAQTLSTMMGVVMIIGALVNVVIGIMGRRGAKDPAKIKPFFVLCVIGLVLYVMSIIGAFTTGDVLALLNCLFSLVLVIPCLFFADKVKKEA